MVKVTFTLDDQTVARLRQAAARLNRPQSQVVRDAVRD
jgi:predicted transcriptional regulator